MHSDEYSIAGMFHYVASCFIKTISLKQLVLLAMVAATTSIQADAFTPISVRNSCAFDCESGCCISLRLLASKQEPQDDSNLAPDDFNEKDLQSSGAVIDDLSWRVEKMRLEEANRRRFLKAKPRFLPYNDARQWVIAFNRWTTEQEWRDWIAMGEKRNSYIPSRPDDYYSDNGDWISWDHFLGVQSDSSDDPGDDFGNTT